MSPIAGQGNTNLGAKEVSLARAVDFPRLVYRNQNQITIDKIVLVFSKLEVSKETFSALFCFALIVFS